MISLIIISLYLVIFSIIFIFTFKNYNKEEKISKDIEIKKNREIKLSSESKYNKMLNQYEKNADITIPIGYNEEDSVKTINLCKSPNLLIIGTTGGGKSILLNNIIASLSINYSKDDIKIITMDTSIVELSKFNSLPHYVKNTLSYPNDILDELDELEKEINRRKTQKEKQPLLVVIDDLYDICSYKNSISSQIIQLLEDAKNQNIFFILTTDTPSKKVLNKKLLDLVDSTIYLTLSPGEQDDFSFSEQLNEEDLDFITKIGNLLYIHGDEKERLEVPEITDKEIKEVTKFYEINKN